MVVMFSSGKGDGEDISEIGISHSLVPTLCGPNGCGTAGITPSWGNMADHFICPLKIAIRTSKWSRA